LQLWAKPRKLLEFLVGYVGFLRTNILRLSNAEKPDIPSRFHGSDVPE
jgi:hypothetical protein